MLYMQDTTPPAVEFQDLFKYLDYEINPNDFIINKSDLSEMTVELGETYEITEFGTNKVNVIVKDEYNNITSKDCNLTIGWVKPEFILELGNKVTKEDLLYSVEQDGDKLAQEDLDTINSSGIGEYKLKLKYDGKEYITVIRVQDTTPPELLLKDVSIYIEEKADKDNFIESVTDASGEVTTTLLTQIDYSNIGTQQVEIEAVDSNGNKIIKTATLTIREDTDGPVFSGLSTITVAKNSNINYTKGVKAVDAKYGDSEFIVDDSKVNTSVAGTYYATYTAKDKKGNTTTEKRKIVVNYDQSDVNAKVREIAQKCGSGVEEIRNYVRNNIRYSHDWGGSNPVWFGFTNWKGNCYVHALCFQELLSQKGYTSQLIWTTDKTHYWNMVMINGEWKHMDSTPDRNHRKISIMSDEQRISTLSGRTWDRSAWPSAK